MVLALLLVGFALPLAAQEPGRTFAVCGPGPTALVLSGGGAKGIAHLGVLAALDSLGARPDLVVGTSMGAIVGGLYASGYSARAIDSMVRALPLGRLIGEPEPPQVPHGWQPMTPLVVWEQGQRGFALQTATVRQSETSALLNAVLLRGNLAARGSFDRMPIPFRAVATDLVTREPVVLSEGDLARAVRASSSVPLVFSPIRTGGQVLTDGGISANIPVGVARQLGAARVIVSDVSSVPLDADELRAPLAVAEQLVGFLFTQSADSLGPEDLYIRHPVKGYSTLDFAPGRLEELTRLGRETADSVLAGADCLPRAPVVSPRPAERIGRIGATGLRPDEAATLASVLGLVEGQPLDEGLLRRRLQRMPEVDGFQEIWLSPSGRDAVDFRLEAVRTPQRIVGLDLAYDNEFGGRVGAGALDRSLFDTGIEASGVMTFGRYVKDLAVDARRFLGVGRSRVAPAVSGRLAAIGVRRFDPDGVELPEEDTRIGSLFVGVDRDLAVWEIRFGFDGRTWHTDEGNGTSGGVVLGVRRAPLDAGVSLSGEVVWSGNYRRAQAEVSGAWHTGRLEITPRARVGWGRGLPSLDQFALGGDGGFPGLHLHERRGQREAFGSVQLEWLVLDPVSFRFMMAAGRVGADGPLLGSDGWLGGARAGIGAETPIGPVRAEYGVTTSGRGAVMIRVGRWF